MRDAFAALLRDGEFASQFHLRPLATMLELYPKSNMGSNTIDPYRLWAGKLAAWFEAGGFCGPG